MHLFILIFCILLIFYVVFWLIMFAKIIISKRWSLFEKTAWAIGLLIFPFLAIIYAFIEEKLAWRLYAIITIFLITAPAGIMPFAIENRSVRHFLDLTETRLASRANGKSAVLSQDDKQILANIDTLEARIQEMSVAQYSIKREVTATDTPSLQMVSIDLFQFKRNLLMHKLTGERIRPYLTILSNDLADGDLTFKEYDGWDREIIAAGLKH